MKFAFVAAVAALAVAGAAIAQTAPPSPVAPPPPPAVPTAEYTACAAVPPAPMATWPDGATARNQDMAAAQTAYQAWETQAQPAIACRRAEQTRIKAVAEATTAQFNTDATRLNAVRAAWKAEADEYQARTANQKKKDNRTGRN